MHLHHIVPKHMGGTDDPSNLVELSVEEHAEAHKKLFEKHGKWEDELAWKALSGQIEMSEASKEAKRQGQILGGKIQGKNSVENGHLSNIRTIEVQRLGAKARYKKHGHIHSNMSEEATQRYIEGHSLGGKIGGPKGMAILNAMKYKCNDCGYTSRPRWVIHHINKTGHTGYTKL